MEVENSDSSTPGHEVGWSTGEKMVLHSMAFGGADFIKVALICMFDGIDHVGSRERGFIDRVLLNYPDALESLAAQIRRTSGRLN
jgi:hypothetical protein